MKALKVIKNPYTGLAFNIAYALGNGVVGFFTYSWWFVTVGAYYTVLATTRFWTLQMLRRSKGNYDNTLFVNRITGTLLIVLSFCLVGVNILSAIKERGTVFHEIIMIAMATYSFAKISLAFIGIAKSKAIASPIVKTLRNISLADAFVSIYTLQRSMLVSFPGLQPDEIRLFNILTGTAVWLVVFLLGINLIGGKYTAMMKSKIIKANEKIAEAVTCAYKKIEQGVVGGYKKIEDKFVDAYLTKDGETVEEAKERLNREQN